jgi:4-alpha-glucanotransferase
MRQAGILLHPSSLPGAGPCGDIGDTAMVFLDWMRQAGLTLWQTLPLHPTGGGFSPYSSPSAFAGATYLLSLDNLQRDGLLSKDEIGQHPWTPRCSPELVEKWKTPLIEKAAARLAAEDSANIAIWADSHPWSRDWALYTALRKEYRVDGWQSFPKELADRKEAALGRAREQHRNQIVCEIAAQKLFFDQWEELRTAAADRGISIVGDMPIFVSADGADTWTHRKLFRLGRDGWPDPVSGAPPDAFSELGQHWGNPLYRWNSHKRDGFSWWVSRLRAEMQLADHIRIDHFRGFCAAWEIPLSAEGDARLGSWGASPGKQIFRAAKKALKELPFLAEDLGHITPDVEELRGSLGLMGMKVLQFAFGNYTHKYLPHTYGSSNFACYTGTHDNDTTLGWYTSSDEVTRHRYRVYAGRSGTEPHWDLIRMAWSSVARWAIAPMQDVLGLGGEARMNLPGDGKGNWLWRAPSLPRPAAARLRHMTEAYGRLPEQQTLEG